MSELENQELTLPYEGEGRCEKAWQRFHNWIHCICVVTFDLELGQALEVSF